MEFLTLLIVLGLLQWWGSGAPLQHDQWFRRWEAIVASNVNALLVKLAITVIIPCLVVLIVQVLFESLLFGLLSLLLYVGVLLFSLGRGDFKSSIEEYLRCWGHGDFEAAYQKAMAIGDFQQSDSIDDYESLYDHVREAVIYEGFERWFAVVFWFVLLGPAGAVAYRLCYLTAHQADGENRLEYQQLAFRVLYYLDWLPARLLVLSFTLTGNFVNCFNHCWQVIWSNVPIPELLDGGASAAISGFHDSNTRPAEKELFVAYGEAQIVALQALLSRSVICWLIIFAVLQLI